MGFALGIAGTEVAKEACDIVILDDNIQSMAKAVLWGRNVYESIRKFLQFQLVVNVVAVTLNFISACAGVELPLGAVPLLWVNMIMDSMGALALSTEPPRNDLLERKPFGTTAPLINRVMYRNIVGVSIYQLAVSLVLQFAGKKIFDLEPIIPPGATAEVIKDLEHNATLMNNSIIFNVFVFMQIFSEINARRLAGKNVFDGILKSAWFMSIIGITVLIQIGLMFGVGSTKVGESIGIVKVDGAAWGAAIVLGALVLPWGFLVRLFPLDWCFGPIDEDPTQMSKLEKALHFPQRKAPVAEAADNEDDDGEQVGAGEADDDCAKGSDETEDAEDANRKLSSLKPMVSNRIMEAGDMQRAARMDGKTRLRVFVHAVAFVNVVSRGTLARPGANEEEEEDAVSRRE